MIMKRICSLLICALLFFSLLPIHNCFADNTESDAALLCISVEQTTLRMDNGWTILRKICVFEDKTANQRTASLTEDFYSPFGEQAASITITGTFSYDGSTVYVLSKSITNLATFNGWHFTLSSFSSSGGTITLSGTLTKALLPSVNISMSLTCDANGNIS